MNSDHAVACPMPKLFLDYGGPRQYLRYWYASSLLIRPEWQDDISGFKCRGITSMGSQGCDFRHIHNGIFFGTMLKHPNKPVVHHTGYILRRFLLQGCHTQSHKSAFFEILTLL